MEIERKFLVKQLPKLEPFQSKPIIQAYISLDPVIRLRQINNAYYLSVKSKGAMSREELELNLTHTQFLSLWNKIEGTPIQKIRYLIPIDQNLVAELDIYQASLEGLLTVEVEFSSLEEASNFEPPSWFGEDISFDNRYKNNVLSLCGLPK